HLARLITYYLDRVGQEIANNAFLYCMMELFGTGRHLFFRPAVYNVHFAGPGAGLLGLDCLHALTAPGSIHSNVAAADYRYFFPEFNGRSVIRKEVSLHKIYAREKLICGHNAVKVYAGDAHK